MTKDDFLRALLGGSSQGASGYENVQKNQLALEKQKAEAQALDELRQKYGENVNVHVGDVSVGAKDPLMALLRKEQMQKTDQERQDKALESFGKRIESAKIPEITGTLKDIQASIPAKGQDFKSIGGLKSAVPTFATPFAEFIGKLTGGKVGLPEGASQERQALEAAKQLVRHPLYGSALTPSEKASFEAGFGALVGANTDDVRKNLARMEAIPRESLKSIEATTRPNVVQEYANRGGITSQQLSQIQNASMDATAPTQSNPSDIRKKRIAELRAKLGK